MQKESSQSVAHECRRRQGQGYENVTPRLTGDGYFLAAGVCATSPSSVPCRSPPPKNDLLS